MSNANPLNAEKNVNCFAVRSGKLDFKLIRSGAATSIVYDNSNGFVVKTTVLNAVRYALFSSENLLLWPAKLVTSMDIPSIGSSKYTVAWDRKTLKST
jgi:hypothetical protein